MASCEVGGGCPDTAAGLLAGYFTKVRREIIGVSEMDLDITRFVRSGVQSHGGMFSSSSKSPNWSAHK